MFIIKFGFRVWYTRDKRNLALKNWIVENVKPVFAHGIVGGEKDDVTN